jgi:hypothetical protein
VDAVNPQILLGLMTGEITYSGYGDADWVAAMAGKNGLPVKWRPGGGNYTDTLPQTTLAKAHSVGRQVSLLPESVADIQYEHENFPYQVLKKSRRIFTTEIAASIAAGCTGAALNLMGISRDPFDEYLPYFEAVRAGRDFFDQAAAAFGRRACRGIWPAFGQDHFAALNINGSWDQAVQWGVEFNAYNELAEIGLPPAYTAEGACVTILSAASVLEFDHATLRQVLTGGVLMDAPALEELTAAGLGELAGFEVAGKKEVDTKEQFTPDPLNGRFAGWQRDCRPSFWMEPSYWFNATAEGARPLAELIDFTGASQGPCAGVYQNRLGGRVAVLGYYPWSSLQTLSKSTQLKAVMRWLSQDRLPAYIENYAKAALWCRTAADGKLAMLLVNPSLDPADGLTLLASTRGDALILQRMDNRSALLVPQSTDGPYTRYLLPEVGPWEPVLLVPEY